VCTLPDKGVIVSLTIHTNLRGTCCLNTREYGPIVGPGYGCDLYLLMSMIIFTYCTGMDMIFTY